GDGASTSEEERQIELDDLVVATGDRLVDAERHRQTGAELQRVAQHHVEARPEAERQVVARVARRVVLNVAGRADPGLIAEVETSREPREEEVAGVETERHLLVRGLLLLPAAHLREERDVELA